MGISGHRKGFAFLGFCWTVCAVYIESGAGCVKESKEAKGFNFTVLFVCNASAAEDTMEAACYRTCFCCGFTLVGSG